MALNRPPSPRTPLTAPLPRDVHAPARAREHVERFRCGLTALQRTDAILAISELVSAAFLRGTGRMTLYLQATGGGLRAEVLDEGNGFPLSFSDLNLQVVHALSDAWGVAGAGESAWFEIGLRNGAGNGGLVAV